MNLDSLGLTTDEYKTYTEILKNPPEEIAELAERTGIKRSTLYSVLESLLKKGLIEEPQRTQSEARYHAVKPDQLVKYAKKNFDQINSQLEELKNQVPLLNIFATTDNMDKPSKEDSEYYSYYNEESFAFMYEIVDKSTSQMWGLTDHHYFEDCFKYDKKTLKVKDSQYLETIKRVGDRFVFTGTPEMKKEAEDYLTANPELVGRWEPRFIDREKFHFDLNINTFNDKVLITEMNAPRWITHYLRNKIVAESIQRLCKYLWETAEPIEPQKKSRKAKIKGKKK